MYFFCKTFQDNTLEPIHAVIVDANLGQHTNALDRAAQERARCSSPCVERSDRSKEPVRPVAGENRRRPTNTNPGGTPSG